MPTPPWFFVLGSSLGDGSAAAQACLTRKRRGFPVLRVGIEEPHDSSNIISPNFIRRGNFAADGRFAFLPHFSKVIAR